MRFHTVPQEIHEDEERRGVRGWDCVLGAPFAPLSVGGFIYEGTRLCAREVWAGDRAHFCQFRV